jgi:DNA-binding GntR family transcriptional regulator
MPQANDHAAEQRVVIDPSRSRDIAAEHKAMADAALARDTATACGLLRAHLQATTDIVLRHARGG